MAKSNIGVFELTKFIGTKDKNLMGDLEEGTATKKAISVPYLPYLALGMAAQKGL